MASVICFILIAVCTVSAQYPTGRNYSPLLSYPYTAKHLAEARTSHVSARAKRNVEDTPEVKAATIEHYRAYNAAAAANGVIANLLPARYSSVPWTWKVPQQVQETPEVAAARQAHTAAHAFATASAVSQSQQQPILLANQNLANSVASATNGLILGLPSFFPQVNWGAPAQFVQDTPEVLEAKLAFFRAFYEAFFRSS